MCLPSSPPDEDYYTNSGSDDCDTYDKYSELFEWDEASEFEDISDPYECALESFPFLDYAASNVFYHADCAQEAGVDQLEFLTEFDLSSWIPLHNFLSKESKVHRGWYWDGKVYSLCSLNEVTVFQLVRDLSPGILDSDTEDGTLQDGTLLEGPTTEDNQSVTKMLLRKGLNFWDLRDYSILSALHFAVLHGDIESVRVQLEKTNANVKDGIGRTALHYAVISSEQNETIVKILLDKTDANIQDENGKTALHYAVACLELNEHVVKLLLEKVDANIQDEDGRTVLHEAMIFEQNETIVKLLLEKVDANIQDADGKDSPP